MAAFIAKQMVGDKLSSVKGEWTRRCGLLFLQTQGSAGAKSSAGFLLNAEKNGGRKVKLNTCSWDCRHRTVYESLAGPAGQSESVEIR